MGGGARAGGNAEPCARAGAARGRRRAAAAAASSSRPRSSLTHTTIFSPPRHHRRYVVLFFYPLDFTFVCPTEIVSAELQLCFLALPVEAEGGQPTNHPLTRRPPPRRPPQIAFSDRAAEFRALGAELLGCSVDSQFSHLAWIEAPRAKGGLGGLSYPLLSDLTKVRLEPPMSMKPSNCRSPKSHQIADHPTFQTP